MVPHFLCIDRAYSAGVSRPSVPASGDRNCNPRMYWPCLGCYLGLATETSLLAVYVNSPEAERWSVCVCPPLFLKSRARPAGPLAYTPMKQKQIPRLLDSVTESATIQGRNQFLKYLFLLVFVLAKVTIEMTNMSFKRLIEHFCSNSPFPCPLP